MLGPLLFVIYINDIVYASDQDKILKLFADDVKSYMSGSSSDCKERFCISVNDILKWADTWQLPVAFKNPVGASSPMVRILASLVLMMRLLPLETMLN